MNFFQKKSQDKKPQKGYTQKIEAQNILSTPNKAKKEEIIPNTKQKKVTHKNKKNMDTAEKVELAKQILGDTNPNQIKIVKGDNELIEHSESCKTILTEDNKELLRD